MGLFGRNEGEAGLCFGLDWIGLHVGCGCASPRLVSLVGSAG
jgi:hypothetical protein